MPRWIRTLLIAAAVVVATGLLVIWSGLINIGASTGHWAATEWLLHFAMRRSVETQSMGIDAPPLDDPAMVRRGAGHYVAGCAPCHGAPGVERSAVVRQMTPPPPYLPPRIEEWDAAELFWIVRHGVKLTGMPAWPAIKRTDEVWAVVAFLRRLPRLSEEEYRRLAYGAAVRLAATSPSGVADRAPPALAGCVRCHGLDGGTDGGAFPRLAGQSETYMLASLRAFADGTRHSGMMQAAVSGLDPDDLRRLARYYASIEPDFGHAGEAAANPEGRRIAMRGAPERGVPPCASCHGLAEGPRYPHYPSLAGQPAGYLALQLGLFRRGVRGGTPYAHIMRSVAERLTDSQIAAVTRFYASLAPAGSEAR